MAKYYVESGQVRVVFDAEDATEAAVRAFQWSYDKQAGIKAESPLEHVQQCQRAWLAASGQRTRDDALVLDTLDVVAIWQGSLFPWV